MTTDAMGAATYFCGFEPLSSAQQRRLMPEALPQWLRAEAQADSVVVCLHGFGGTPYEANPVAQACAAAGLDAVTVLLPGHGYWEPRQQRREFAQLTCDSLLAAARQTLATARQRYRRVGMFGLSMGGAIALLMAAEQRLDACAVAAPALRLPVQGEVLIPLLSWASFALPVRCKYDFHVPRYDFYHSWALRALWQVRREAQRRLPEVDCPVYAAHSQQDTTISPAVMELLHQGVSAPLKTAWFNRSGHVMPLDVSGAEVSQAVAQFMAQELAA